MTQSRRRKATALSEEQLLERFSTDGKSFEDALAAVVAGGQDDEADGTADEREADK